jgi:hypothetical protein
MTFTNKERSYNRRLIVSEGIIPHEEFIADPTLPVALQYSFGGPGLQNVVIPKGLACAFNGRTVDPEDGKRKTVLTISDGTKPFAGIAPYNIAKRMGDGLTGNEPTVIRKYYIELPLIRNADDCAAVQYGAVYGNIQEGDLVKVSTDSDNPGHLTKWENDDGFAAIVGQVWAVEEEQEPWGWFKYVMWDELARQQDSPMPPFASDLSSAPLPGGRPYNDRYRDGTIDISYYMNQYLTNPKGVPGLTDGTQRAATTWAESFTLPAAVDATTKMNFTLKYKNVIPNTIAVTITVPGDLDGGPVTTPVESTNVLVDYKTGKVVVEAPDTLPAESIVNVSYKAFFYGTPPGWDFHGTVGAVRILLV